MRQISLRIVSTVITGEANIEGVPYRRSDVTTFFLRKKKRSPKVRVTAVLMEKIIPVSDIVFEILWRRQGGRELRNDVDGREAIVSL